jgi:hypothetical protein
MKEIHALRDPVFSGNLRAAFGTVGGENLPGSSAPHFGHSVASRSIQEAAVRWVSRQHSWNVLTWDIQDIPGGVAERLLTSETDIRKFVQATWPNSLGSARMLARPGIPKASRPW